jgi:hypothetical protein
VKRLYFDIDGTLLVRDSGEPKPALGHGRFERAVREAGFEQIVCVGNFIRVIREMGSFAPDYDGPGIILRLCAGVFADEAWFRAKLSLVLDPRNRAAEVDTATDWWYVDDEAEAFFARAGRSELFRQHLGGRILVPQPQGDGADVLGWLRGSVRA